MGGKQQRGTEQIKYCAKSENSGLKWKLKTFCL
jgi:hypothetical protein